MQDQQQTSPPDAAETSDRTLIFVHVPKTAGTTLNRVIESQYNPLHIYTIPGGNRVWSIERFKRLSESRRRKLRVLKGHMGFGLHRYIPNPSTHFTMLRDPVNQVVSSYYYAISHRGHPLHRVIVEKQITLEQFVDLAPWGNNLQTKLLGGMAMSEVNPSEALAAAKRGEFVPPDEFAGRHCDSETQQAARRNLTESFSVVGLTERFEESLAWMMIEYGWHVPYYQRFRKSSKRPATNEVDDRVRQKIEEYNSFDIELYAFGQQIFEEAMARHKDEVERIREAFRSAAQPGAMTSYLRSGVAWSRGLASIIRSAT